MKRSCKGPNTDARDQLTPDRQIRLAPHGRSIHKYMVKRRGPPRQGWRTFLRNHAPDEVRGRQIARFIICALHSCGIGFEVMTVAGGQDYEVRYAAKKSRKSPSAVKKAVKKVGSSRKKVKNALSRR